MSPEHWQLVEEIFGQALDLPREERVSFLDGACGSNRELREQVEFLLKCDEEAGTFIAEPAFDVRGVVTNAPGLLAAAELTGDFMLGRRIGQYRIVREIGHGGMGAVYLAERADDEFRKNVAIKLVKRGMDTDFILRRFRNERQILASLEHPNIARLFDGGTTDDGLPYFVMEYIEGQPVHRFCNAHRLTIADRLRLFLQVCAAVAHAHRNLVVHRDIKPSNILVTPDGVPKLLDFGIAKILKSDFTPVTIDPTMTSMRMLTPKYASPEQLRGAKVTPSSDIYSLGVLLYELLTGHHPYHLADLAPHEVARRICEEDPERPSAAVNRPDDLEHSERSGEYDGGRLSAPQLVGRNRSAQPEDLRRELARGLDAVVLRAVRKQPAARYATVEDFAADLRNYLEGAPVSASPYRSPAPPARPKEEGEEAVTARKAVAVLPLKVMSVGTDDTGGGYLGVGLAAALITRLSNLRSVTLRPTSSVLKYADEEVDPVLAGRALAVDFVLDGRALRAGDRLRVTVQLVSVENGAPLWAGQFDENSKDILSLQDSISAQVAGALVPHLEGEERARVVKRGTESAKAYEAYLRGRYYAHTYTESDLEKAVACFREAVALDPNYAQAHSGVADYYNWLAVSGSGTLPPSECFRQAKVSARRAVEIDDQLAEAHVSLAFAVWAYDWDSVESERLFRRAIELNSNLAHAHQWYSHLLSAGGRHDEAVLQMRRALAIDPNSAPVNSLMSYALYHARRYEESLKYLQRSLELQPDYYVSLQACGWVYPLLGRAQEAFAPCRRAVEISGRAPLTLWALAYLLAVTGDRKGARALLGEMNALAERRYVPSYFMAVVHTTLGEFDKTFACLDRAIEEHDFWALWLPVEPRLDALRADPRYESYAARIRRPAFAPAPEPAPRFAGDHADTIHDSV
ncbi:MAG TPA: protein kinase, partial [Pyrinomonadaceae bacterium]|nr:protein kinase [Pyrinomonadaceae bacterium]